MPVPRSWLQVSPTASMASTFYICTQYQSITLSLPPSDIGTLGRLMAKFAVLPISKTVLCLGKVWSHWEPSFTKIFCFNLPQQKQVTFQLWLTYRSCSIDDCCHGGQGSCIPFQTFMGTLKRQRLLRTILSWTLYVRCILWSCLKYPSSDPFIATQRNPPLNQMVAYSVLLYSTSLFKQQ